MGLGGQAPAWTLSAPRELSVLVVAELISALRAHPLLRAVPFIFLTRGPGANDPRRSLLRDGLSR